MSKKNQTISSVRHLRFLCLGVCMLLFLVLTTLTEASFYTYPFQDPSLPLEIRVDDLLSRLTLEEKISFYHQYIPAIDRLSIPAFRTGTEALHGIAWLGKATVFPQATGLGCTWDVDLLKRVGSAVGDEARGYHKKDPVLNGLSLWAPVADLERDPRAGRFEEGYGEDPFLVGQLAIAYGMGLKGDHPFYYKAIPTLKHFYAYNQEADRDIVSVNIDDRNKNEYYLKAFKYPVKAGAVKSLMTSYNLVNGIPCTVAPEINSLVKNDWAKGKDFFVVTDAYAPDNLTGAQAYYADVAHSHAAMIKAGVDSMTQDDSNPADTVNNITNALSQGLITVADIDRGVKNILRVRFHLGEFDPEENNPYARLDTSEICADDHAELAYKAAQKQLVLLKNNSNVLPLNKKNLRKVAVIGPLADQVFTDFYSAPFPYTKSVLTGIRGKIADSKIVFSRGVDQIAFQSLGNGCFVTAPSEGGQLTATGESIGSNEIYDLYDFGWGQYLFRSHANDLYLTGNGNWSALVQNTANAPGVQEDAVAAQQWFTYQNFNYELQSDGAYTLYNYQVSHWNTGLTGGKYVSVASETAGLTSSAESIGNYQKFKSTTVTRGLDAAVAAADGVDAAIVVVGNEPMLNGRETLDRQDITLPAYQEELITKVAEVNRNTIVVLVSSYPMAIGTIQKNPNVKAILYSAHGGQEEGTAIADVLFGDYAPAGRLNCTWYQSIDQLPDMAEYDIINGKRTYMYFDGEPLYPFGYGLTYTTFRYSNLKITPAHFTAKDQATISVMIENTGNKASDEVVQLYVRDIQATVKRQIKELKGFKRITLKPGEKQKVSFTLPASELAYWDVTRNDFYVEPGAFEVMIGRSSADIKLTGMFNVWNAR